MWLSADCGYKQRHVGQPIFVFVIINKVPLVNIDQLFAMTLNAEPSAPPLEEASPSDHDHHNNHDQQPSLQLRDAVKYEAVNGFAGSLSFIYEHSMQDISDALFFLELSTLQDLRQSLVNQLCCAFPQLKNLRVKGRKVKRTLISDIYAAGLSLTEQCLCKDIDKMFTILSDEAAEEDADSLEQNDWSALLKVTTNLSNKVSCLEEELSFYKESNQLLRNDVDDCMRTIASLRLELASIPSTPTIPSAPLLPSSPLPPPPPPGPSSADARAREVKETSNTASSSGNSGTSMTRDGVVSLHEKVPQRPLSSQQQTGQSSSQRGCALRSAPQPPNMSSLYVGGLDASHTPKEVEDHLIKLGVKQPIRVRILTTRNSWRSYRADFPKQNLKPLMDSRKWPQNTKVRPFGSEPPKKKQPQPRHTLQSVKRNDHQTSPKAGIHPEQPSSSRSPPQQNTQLDERAPAVAPQPQIIQHPHETCAPWCRRPRPTEHWGCERNRWHSNCPQCLH